MSEVKVHLWNCLLCSSQTMKSDWYHILDTKVEAKGTSLISYLSEILNQPEEKISSLQRDLLCINCYSVIIELAVLQDKTTKITQDLQSAFSQSVQEYEAQHDIMFGARSDNSTEDVDDEIESTSSFDEPQGTTLAQSGLDYIEPSVEFQLPQVHSDELPDQEENTASNPAKEIGRKSKIYSHNCNLCKRTFRRPGRLKKHLEVHQSKSIYKCELCDYVFTRRSDASIHNHKVHGIHLDVINKSICEANQSSDAQSTLWSDSNNAPNIEQLNSSSEEVAASVQTSIVHCVEEGPRGRGADGDAHRSHQAEEGNSVFNGKVIPEVDREEHNIIFGPRPDSTNEYMEDKSSCAELERTTLTVSETSQTGLEYLEPSIGFPLAKVYCDKLGDKDKNVANIATTTRGRQLKSYSHNCHLCKRTFRRPGRLKRHLEIHKNRTIFKCELCDYVFDRKANVSYHAHRAHGLSLEKKYSINEAEKSKNIYSTHWSDSDDGYSDSDTNYVEGMEHLDSLCTTGEAASNVLATAEQEPRDGGENKDAGTSHLTLGENRTCISKVTPEEEIEGKMGKANDSTQNVQQILVCPEGQNKWKRVRIPRSAQPEEFACELCGKRWRKQSELNTHMKTHSEERPYVCEICGQAYKHKKACDIHVGIHSGISPYTCQHCNKVFTQRDAMLRHQRIHTGEGLYQCDLCGKCFIHITSFKVHMSYHSGDKSYFCDTCGQGFVMKSSLRRHILCHTGEKPHECDTCGKSFAARYNLIVHLRLHNGDSSRRRHRCQICDLGFDRKHKLEEHLASAHNKVLPEPEKMKKIETYALSTP